MSVTSITVEPPAYSVIGTTVNFTSTGVYNYDGEEEVLLNIVNFSIYNYITEESFENLSGTTKTITYQGQTESGGYAYTINFSISFTDTNFISYFKQYRYFNFFVRYTDDYNNVPSGNNSKYFVIPMNYSLANIAMTDNNIKTITTINMNNNKSVFLPDRTLCQGMVFHFKLRSISILSSYVFQIFPLLTEALPTTFSFANAMPTFQCSIENNASLSLSDETYKCISLVADSENWRIVNYYKADLITDVSTTIPASTTILTNPTKNITYFRWDISGNSYRNIHISSSNESNYKINFLTILNMYSTINSDDTFRIYFPYEKSVDGKTESGKYTYIELLIAKHKIYSIMYSKDNSGYFILGSTNYDGVSVEDVARTNEYTLINKNIVFLTSPYATNEYEFDTTTSELVNSARIHILKINEDDTQVNSNKFYTPYGVNANIIFNNSNATMIELAGAAGVTKSKGLWLSIRHQTSGNTSIIIPINYYNGDDF